MTFRMTHRKALDIKRNIVKFDYIKNLLAYQKQLYSDSLYPLFFSFSRTSEWFCVLNILSVGNNKIFI